MRKMIACVLAVVAIALACFLVWGCGRKKPRLNLFCWCDYISPELIAEFEKENGCEVVVDIFDSNEVLLAKMQAGATGYDLIFPSQYVVDSLVSAGTLQKLDHSKLTILGNIDRDVLAQLPDGKCEYCVPYMISYTGIGYNKNFLKDGFDPSWRQFENPALNRRASLLDDHREVIGAALMTLGYDPNSLDDRELAEAKELVLKWCGNIIKFDNEVYKNSLASEEFFIAMGYSGDVVQLMKNSPHVGFFIPKEGCLANCDVLAMPAGAGNPDLAYKFINFVHKPENAARNMEFVYYCSPNSAAYPLVSEELKSNGAVFVDRETLKRCKFIIDQRENEKKFTDLWEQIKNSK